MRIPKRRISGASVVSRASKRLAAGRQQTIVKTEECAVLVKEEDGLVKTEEAVKVEQIELSASPKLIPDIEEPPHWREMLDKIREMRAKVPAPVDSMGCERIPDSAGPLTARNRRFELLITLMLSAQTKDETNFATMVKLRKELKPVGGLTLQGVRATPVDRLDSLIYSVGFHTKKAKYIKDACEILAEEFDGDIPHSIEDMIRLPGVGPKMAYLLRSAAWDITDGIGVDVHVHRLATMWKWVPKMSHPTPEKTRAALESWLPREHWREINSLLVGFGQTICPSRNPYCSRCTLADGLCNAAFRKGAK